MSDQLRITAVSYLNTIPFLYGIKDSGYLPDVSVDIAVPSQCAARLLAGESDVALVPVGALPDMKDMRVVTGYCLGAEGAVGSVFLVSGLEAAELERVYLDTDSMTSVRLAKLLYRKYWNASPEFVEGLEGFDAANPGRTGAVVIGDKAFGYMDRVDKIADLSEAWHAWTGLPFVFAVWVARGQVSDRYISDLDRALAYGTSHIREALEAYPGTPAVEDPYNYLTECIDYKLDAQKRKALDFFLREAFVS